MGFINWGKKNNPERNHAQTTKIYGKTDDINMSKLNQCRYLESLVQKEENFLISSNF